MTIKRTYHNNGNIKAEYWVVDSQWHRLDGPAFIEHYEDGNIMYEEWRVNGITHRIDGPACIWYDENINGMVEAETWYVHDILIEDHPETFPLTHDQIVEIKLKYG